jgi:hypothetical protein
MNVIASPGGSFPGRGDLSPGKTHATLTEAIMTCFFLVKTAGVFEKGIKPFNQSVLYFNRRETIFPRTRRRRLV